jgi:F-box protein 11
LFNHSGNWNIIYLIGMIAKKRLTFCNHPFHLLIVRGILLESIYVAKSSFSDFQTITEAIQNAKSGTKILLEPGEYNESIVIDKSVELIGNGPIDKIIIFSDDQSTVIQMQTDQAVVRGITIHQRGVKKEAQSADFADDLLDKLPTAIDLPMGSITLDNCHIISDIGNGISVMNSNTRPIIQRCHIGRTYGVGLLISQQANPSILDCQISEGLIGVAITNGLGTILDCQVYQNRAANIAILFAGNPIIRGCKIHRSPYGICVSDQGFGVIEQCELYSNIIANVYIQSEGNPEIKGCKIYNSEYGIEVTDRGRGIVKDCKIFGHAKRNISISKDSCITPSHSLAQRDRKLERYKSVDYSLASVEITAVLKELDMLVGLNNVKKRFREIVDFYNQFIWGLSKFYNTEMKVRQSSFHTILYGNPGTGKKTVARLLGKLYKAMGFMSSGHIVLVNHEMLVSEDLWQTALKMRRKIEKAMGGILFIDQIDQLISTDLNMDFSDEVIAVLLEEMENRTGELTMIITGDDQEVISFLEANPGLKSRFKQNLYLQDYTLDELVEIAQKMLRDQQRKLSNDAERLLYEKLASLRENREYSFENARTVEKYVEAMLQAQAKKNMGGSPEQQMKGIMLMITPEDVEAAFAHRTN